jgi:hypothetical protein
MSGFRGHSGWYDLTMPKALYWHQYRADGCRSLDDIINAHVWDEGFTVEDHPTWVRVTGPGLVDGWTSDLYLAISGASPERADRSPERRWKH